MHDNLGQLLRDGTSQVAQDLTPAPAHLVRARGSRRSRRKAAGATALAVALIAAAGGGAYALSQQPHPRPAVVAPGTPTPTAVATPKPSMTPTQLKTPTGASATPSGRATTSLQPTSSSTTTAPAIVITVCQDPAVSCEGAEMVTEPTQMSANADGNRTVRGITWSGWGSATATGTGTMGVNNCDPNCANGTYTYYPATVTVSGLTPYLSGTEGYDTIVFSAPTAPGHPTTTFKNYALPTSTDPYSPPATTGP
jgi:hypothetical protein